MRLQYFKLCHLLELGFRCPDVGGLNFNAVYLVLKTIIKKFGFENIIPADTIQCDNESSAEFLKYFQFLETVYNNEKEGGLSIFDKMKSLEKEGGLSIFDKMKSLEKEVEVLSEKVNYLEEKKPETDSRTDKEIQTVDMVGIQDQEGSGVGRDSRPEEDIPDMVEVDSKPGSETGNEIFNVIKEEIKTVEFRDYMIDLIKDANVELSDVIDRGLQNGLGNTKVEMDGLKERILELENEFKTVVDGFSKIGLQMEGLNKIDDRLIIAEHSIETLNGYVEQLNDYVYSGDAERPITPAPDVIHTKEQPDEKGISREPGTFDPQISLGTDGKPNAIQTEFSKFLELARKVKEERQLAEDKSIVEEERTETKPEPLDTGSSEEVSLTPLRKLTDLVRTVQLNKEKANAEVPSSPPSSPSTSPTEMEEVIEPVTEERPTETAPEELPRKYLEVPVKSSSSSSSSDSSIKEEIDIAELKAWVLLYVHEELKKVKGKLNANIAETYELVRTQQKEANNIIIDLQTTIKGLNTDDSSLREVKQSLSVLEKNVADIRISMLNLYEILQSKMDKKSLAYSVTQNDLVLLENKILDMNKHFKASLKFSFKKIFRRFELELSSKVNGSDVEPCLKALTNKMRQIEKLFDKINLKIRALEFEQSGPIHIKQYLHCQDGTRIKPVERLQTRCFSEAHKALSMESNKSVLDEELPKRILVNIRERLAETFRYASNHYMAETDARSSRQHSP